MLRPAINDVIAALEGTPTKGQTYKVSWGLWPLFIVSILVAVTYSVGSLSESQERFLNSQMNRIVSLWSGLSVNSSRSVRPFSSFCLFSY
jgi:hypothetical protein